MAGRIMLVRHGEIEECYGKGFVGSTDSALGDEGRAQVARLARLVAVRRPLKCFSSPMLRARQTAEAVAAPLGLEAIIDPDLREVDFGRWEGLTFEEIVKGFPKEVTRWNEFASDFAFPGGDLMADFLARVHTAAGRLLADPAETVLAVTHAGVIRAMLCRLLGLDARSYVLFDVRCGSMATVDVFEGGGVLSGLNESWPEGENRQPGIRQRQWRRSFSKPARKDLEG